jgi:cytidylate kinase
VAEAFVIAVDGPSGVGKSTVSRRVATHFDLNHLDTGALYRAATLAVLESGIPSHDTSGVVGIVRDLVLDQADGVTTLDGVDVSRVIRSEAVTSAVSEVSAIPEVRRILVEMQRRWVEAHGERAVVEGRDIGSVVFPDAALKIYLTADPDERARRRSGEAGTDHGTTREAIERRDAYDSTRPVSPLTVAEGAIVIDTTHLTLPEVVDLVIAEATLA